MSHVKCRNAIYPGTSTLKRAFVPDDKVHWNVDWPNYEPVVYTCEKIKNQPWADPDLKNLSFKPNWNALDGKVNRKSFMGNYNIIDGMPQNPAGRTGVRGRGLLGRWGPNHAADPIVTRWKRDEKGDILKDELSGKRILQAVLIERKDSGEWAIPGGMVDPGETVSTTLQREFMEEALNSLKKTSEEKKKLENQLKDFFFKGQLIYQGYVDDPRNTDNAWIETVAMNFHDENGKVAGQFSLNAGDDAVGCFWWDISRSKPLYASHVSLIETVVKKFDAFW